MVANVDVSDELTKAIVNFAFVAVLGGVAALMFGVAKRRREIEFESRKELHSAYGTFFGTWKKWEAAGDTAVDHDPGNVPDDVRLPLLQTATDLEAEFEALLLKVASERRLSRRERDYTGRLREGWQELREGIEERRKLPFRVQYDDDKIANYVAFKALAVSFGILLKAVTWSRPRTWTRPSRRSAQRSFVQITSWRSGSPEGWARDPGVAASAKQASTTLKSLRRLWRSRAQPGSSRRS
jgi:hypothetical protein